MSWLDVAYLTIFISNFLFLALTAGLLFKILGATQRAKIDQLEVISETSVAAKELHSVAKQLARRMDLLTVESPLATRKSDHPGATSDVPAPAAVPAKPASGAEELTQRLRDKLKDVLTQNMHLKVELERSKANLAKMDTSSKDIHTGLGEVRGADSRDSALVKDLSRMTEGLQLDLEEARRRAQAAEKLAFANAEKLEDLRESISAKSFSETASLSAQVERLREQNDALQSREASFLTRIASMEKEFERHLTEKSFIEDRYVKLDEQAPSIN
jgi:hypothetical protein